MATVVLTDIQKVSVGIEPKSAAGNPAPVEDVRWSSSDETVVVVVASEDGLTAEVTTTGKLGNAQVSVVADARIGEEVSEIAGTLDVEVKASDAVALGITTGVPASRITE